MGFFLAIIGIFAALRLVDKLLGISDAPSGKISMQEANQANVKTVTNTMRYAGPENDREQAVEILLSDTRKTGGRTHGTNFSDDVIYVGRNVIIDDDESVEEWQVMHIFDTGMVRLYSNRPRGYQNEERDVSIDKLRPIHYLGI